MKKLFMKKVFISVFAAMLLGFCSCNNNTGTTAPAPKDSTANSSPDSAANNGIIPPSAAPGNANNSSLADTTYKANDTSRKAKK
jgi:hypothetical protein